MENLSRVGLSCVRDGNFPVFQGGNCSEESHQGRYFLDANWGEGVEISGNCVLNEALCMVEDGVTVKLVTMLSFKFKKYFYVTYRKSWRNIK